MLSREEVQHIAKLARIGLSEEEVEKFQKELSSILEFVEKLNEVDTSSVQPTSHAVDVVNAMRKDESVHETEQAQKLMKAAPDTKDNFVKVKSIL